MVQIFRLYSMSDGDVVHAVLPHVFHGAYREVCSDGFEAEDVAHVVAIPLKKTLQEYGDAPVQFLTECFQQCCNGIPDNLGEVIETLSRHYSGDQVGIQVARDAARVYFDDCRSDETPVEYHTLIEMYGKRTYQVKFVGKIPLNTQHYNYLHSDEFADRLSAIEPFIDLEVQTFAKQIVRDNSIAKLRRRSFRGEPIGLYEDAY